MLTSSFPRWPGDFPGSHVLHLAEHLADEQDAEVTVLAPGDPEAPPRERIGPVEVIRLQYFRPRRWQRLAYGDGVLWNLRRSPLAWLNMPGFAFALAAGLIRHARKADVIHAHWGPIGALALVLRPAIGRPVAVTIHGSDLTTPLAPVRRLTRFAIRQADATIAVSREFQQFCQELRGESAPCFWIPHGVDDVAANQLRRHEPGTGTDRPVRVISVGRLIPSRRHDLLLRAFARARQKLAGLTLTIVGDGPQREPLARLAGQLGVGEATRLPGRVDRTEVPRWLGEADVYVSPTTVETFGFATAEAALHGLPVITTRVGFPAELVVDGVTGYVVAPGDEGAIFEALIKLCEDPAGRRRMGREMGQRAAALGLTWRKCAERTAEAYRICIANARARLPGRAGRPT